MKELRRNEYVDMLEMKELIFEEKDHSIIADLPNIGTASYFPKSNKLQIHKGNKWIENGFYYVKNKLK